MRQAPDWDLLIIGLDEEPGNYHYFPARVRDCKDFLALEGLKFHNCYVTSNAIETGSYVLFQILYRTAAMMGGKVLHITDYRESEDA